MGAERPMQNSTSIAAHMRFRAHHRLNLENNNPRPAKHTAFYCLIMFVRSDAPDVPSSPASLNMAHIWQRQNHA